MVAAGTGCAMAPSSSEPPAPHRDVLLGGNNSSPCPASTFRPHLELYKHCMIIADEARKKKTCVS